MASKQIVSWATTIVSPRLVIAMFGGIFNVIYLNGVDVQLMKKTERKKLSCHYKLPKWHRDRLKRLAQTGRRTMTSVIEELIEDAK